MGINTFLPANRSNSHSFAFPRGNCSLLRFKTRAASGNETEILTAHQYMRNPQGCE